MRVAPRVAGLGVPGAAGELRHLLFFTPVRLIRSRQAPADCFQLCREVCGCPCFILGLSWGSTAHGDCLNEGAGRFHDRAPNPKQSLLSSRIFIFMPALDLEQGCLALGPGPHSFLSRDFTVWLRRGERSLARSQDTSMGNRVQSLPGQVTLGRSLPSPGPQLPHLYAMKPVSFQDLMLTEYKIHSFLRDECATLPVFLACCLHQHKETQ